MKSEQIENIAKIAAKTVNPHSCFLWTKKDWNKYYSKYEYEWTRILDICESLRVDPKEYMTGVKYPLWSERFYSYWWHGKLFSRDWAILRFADYKTLKYKENLSPITMEKAFITRTNKFVNNKFDDYFKAGSILLPRVCKDVFKREVSVSYMSVHPEFKRLYKELPNDVKEEFFDTERLYNLEQAVKSTPEIYRHIRIQINKKEKKYGYKN